MSEHADDTPSEARPFDTAACGLLRLRADGTIAHANRRACEWLGFADGELDGRRFLALLTAGGRIFYQTHWAPLLSMQGSVAEVKLDLVTKTRENFPVIVNAVRVNAGGLEGTDVAFFMARDRDAYERELLLARQRLEASVAETARLHTEANERAIFAEEMVGVVSHDLRNPLSAVQMGTRLLLDGSPSEASRKVLERVLRANERATKLVGNLLDLTQARIGRGLSVVRQEVTLQSIVRDAVDELRLAHPNAVLVLECAGEGTCLADASRLEQALGNLVSNAHAYGAPGRPIRIRSEIDGARFTMSVANEGAPIPDAVRSTMFEPMVRGHDAPERKKGLGLGLYIVLQIARAHGGDAFVRSEGVSNIVGLTMPCR